MKRTILFAMFFSICLLVGCQQAPDEVLKRMENYGEGKQLEKTEKGYYTIEDLRKAKIEDADHVPDNLILPKQIDFSGIESVGKLTLKRYNDYDKNKEAIAEQFGIDNPKWEQQEGMSKWCLYDDDKEQVYLAVDENGDISYFCDALYDSENDNAHTIQKIHLSREDCPNVSCRLGTEEHLLEEVISNVDMWIQNCDHFKGEFEYKPQVVFLKEKEDKTNRVNLLYQRMYRGVGLNYIGYGNGGWNMEELAYVGTVINIAMDEADKPCMVIDETNVYVDEEEQVNEVLSLASAVNLVEETLSGFSKIEICEIRVEYMMQPKLGENKDNNYYVPGAIFHARPVYSFLIEFPEEYDDTLGILECNEYAYVNVDMIDGTITTNFKDRSFHD